MNPLRLLAATALAFVFLASTGVAQPPPNFVVIFIDDMGWEDFSCFGNQDAETPHIDSLAEEGIRFHQFYVNSPICSPSRVALSTGQYPQRHRITSYLAKRSLNAKRGIANWLDPKAPMLARYLKEAGYATGHFGKWHMGGQRDVGDAPEITEYGFDDSLTNFEGIGAKLLPLTERPGKDGEVVRGRIWNSPALGEPVTWMQRHQITGGFAGRAIGFIDEAQREEKPFYVNVWPDDVHGPLWPSLENWADNPRELYLAVLEEMDAQFAPLFDRIRGDKKLRENTLILICSDNGPAKGLGRAGDFTGFKTHLFEGGIRSPLVVWGPGLMEPDALGSVNDASIFSAIDLVPSLLSIAGAEAPAEVAFDGENVSDTLLGKSVASRQQPLYFRRPPDRKSFYDIDNLPDLAVRDGQWKFLCDYDGSRPQLYDIKADPGEATNLAEKHPDVVKRLTDHVLDWNAQLPKDAGDPEYEAVTTPGG